jgi:beta-ureidopropionase / N-carbamoyl-L-amino-acid hydrolase
MLDINAERLLSDLGELSAIGQFRTGVHRPSLSAEHLACCRWLMDKLTAAGLDPFMDGIGNVLGRSTRPGQHLLAGSHLESQNHAGRLDGPLGVLYALETARALQEQRPGHAKGIDVAAWCDEEGHFGSFLGSRSFVGQVSEIEIDKATDRTHGHTMRDALAKAGLAGKQRLTVSLERYLGYFEAHIEQGDVLESERLTIGVVTSIVGLWQYRITFEGVQNHAGTTRMAIRRDAGVALARFMGMVEERMPTVAAERTVWTTGSITLDPGAPSIIPGRADMMFQFRDADPDVLLRLDKALMAWIAEADRIGPCRVSAVNLRKGVPARMDPSMQAAIEAAAQQHAGARHKRIPSGAGHDAQILATVMPAAMLFVPSIGGISHHWTENTEDADIVSGGRVFAAAAGAMLGL